MARFGRVLRRAEAGLRLPSSRRARLLEEVAVDLEEAYRAYRSRGLDDDEAARRAETLLGPSSGAVTELERLHATAYARLLDRLTTRGRHRLERGILAGLVLLAVAAGAQGMMAAGGPRLGDPVVWAVMALAAAAAGLVAAAGLADLRGAAPPRAASFGTLAALAAGAVLVATLGAVLELARLSVAAAGELTAVAVVAAVGDMAEMLALGVIVALLALLAGFHMRSRRESAARRRARIPGLTEPSREENGT